MLVGSSDLSWGFLLERWQVTWPCALGFQTTAWVSREKNPKRERARWILILPLKVTQLHFDHILLSERVLLRLGGWRGGNTDSNCKWRSDKVKKEHMGLEILRCLLLERTATTATTPLTYLILFKWPPLEKVLQKQFSNKYIFVSIWAILSLGYILKTVINGSYFMDIFKAFDRYWKTAIQKNSNTDDGNLEPNHQYINGKIHFLSPL